MVDSISHRLQYLYCISSTWLNLLLHEPQIYMQWWGHKRIESLPRSFPLPPWYIHKYLENDYTVTAYTELYCGDKRVLRNLIQAMLGVGACIGVLFINFFADYKGRKISFLLSVFAGILSIIGSFVK